jgi:ATP synthase protein I
VSVQEPREQRDDEDRETFRREVARKEERKLRARKEGKESVWFGLGMFGLVGWSVAIPTLMGVAVGAWVDHRYGGGQVSWTLTGLVVGLALGCLNAWFWVSRERREIERRRRSSSDEKKG